MTPEPAPLPPFYTQEHFRRNPKNAADLAELIRQPVFQYALAALINAGLPSSTPVPHGFDPLAINAGANQRREGYYEFYTNLVKLAQPAPETQKTTLVPYAHVKRRKVKRGDGPDEDNSTQTKP